MTRSRDIKVTAEPIAKVIQDIRNGRIARLPDVEQRDFVGACMAAQAAISDDLTMIDASAVYEDFSTADTPVMLYEDRMVVPPAKHFTVSYVNHHGNVNVMVAETSDMLKDDDVPEWLSEACRTGIDPPGWRDPKELVVSTNLVGDHQIRWASVRWCITALLFVGGRTKGEPAPTQGPSCMWKLIATGDGMPEDIHWALLTSHFPVDAYQVPLVVLMGAINLLACTNVTAEEPRRTRAESRRLARTGVTLKELVVRPTGGRTRGGSDVPGDGVRLTSVRGHFAHYGACCPTHEPRGLLFGKLTGRYYVPQHARGSAEIGEIQKTYKVEP